MTKAIQKNQLGIEVELFGSEIALTKEQNAPIKGT